MLTNLGSHSPDSTPLCHLHNIRAGSCGTPSRSTYLYTSATAVASRACLLLTLAYLTGEGPLALSPLGALSGTGPPMSSPWDPGPHPLNSSTGSRSPPVALPDRHPNSGGALNQSHSLTGHTPSQLTPPTHPSVPHSTPAPQIPISNHNLPLLF